MDTRGNQGSSREPTPNGPASAQEPRLHRLFPSCRDVAHVQAAAAEGQLSPGCRIGLLLHLLVCGWCRRFGRQIRFIRRAAGVPAELPAAALPAEARDRLKRSLGAGRGG